MGHPSSAQLREPVVLHFRRTVALAAVPSTYIVRVSADNRFVLFVNGHRVGDGPARGDLTHWRYERYDLAPLLHPGQNLIAATVWNFGVYAPIAQMTDRTAFLLESEAVGANSISTPTGWMVEQEQGQRPLPRVANGFWEYMASGPGEKVDAAHYDWAWQDSGAAGSAWVPAASPIRESIYPDVNKAHSADTTGDNPWGLVPDTLPSMEYSPTNPGETVRLDMIGAEQPGLRSFPAAPAAIPGGTHVHLLLDRKSLTTAYPRLTVSGGKGAQINFTYSEALYDKDQHKGDRDDVADRIALGMTDSFLPYGGAHRLFEPLWWRTWRYLDLDIETAAQPLQLESLTANFTAFPFQERARFISPHPDLAKIWEISWRTARLDAHETYMDTPYYEQLQYVGDTRIQALISYAVAGDDRLGRQAIEAFDKSRTQTESPSAAIPARWCRPYQRSLCSGSAWSTITGSTAPTARGRQLHAPRHPHRLDWFGRHERPDGLLGKLPWWSFVDWVPSGEIPTYSASGESCVTTLEYLGALDEAADLEKAHGDSGFASRYQGHAARLRKDIFKNCWSSDRGLIADNPDATGFSQQANILAVLYDVIPKNISSNSSARFSLFSRAQPATASSALRTTSASTWPARSTTPAWRMSTSTPSTPGAKCSRFTQHLARNPRQHPLRLSRLVRPSHL